jgi:cytochrome c oxidase cbb3-type subunit 4
MNVDLPTLRGIVTVVLLVAFLGMVIWAWSSKRTTDFEEAAHLPLDDDSAPGKSNGDQEA